MSKFKLSCAMLLIGIVAPLAADADSNSQNRNKAYQEFALVNGGDADVGKELFNSGKCLCSNCHRISGLERSGPNLGGIADKFSREELIRHVIEPNAIVMPGFGQTIVSLKDGRTITGRIERATKLEVRIIDATGKQTNLKRDEVEQLTTSPTSMMPDNLTSLISKQEFANLVAYLSSLHFGVTTGRGPGNAEIPIPHLQTPVEFSPIHTADLKFEAPVWCGSLPGHPGQLLILEHQEGRIWRLIGEGKDARKELFLDLVTTIHASPNQGLMCLAFHPDYVTNGRYFLEYEIKEGEKVKTLIVERRATEDRLRDNGNESIRLLDVEQPAFNHNGGCIAFGPDGMLYAAFGDGGPQRDPNGYSQNLSELKGSMIRIDVDQRTGDNPYAIPADNPFVANSKLDSSIRPETWAIGFREPWRFSFDSLTGDLWLGDVGQEKYEEVAIVKRGENHGWNVREGFQPYSQEFRRPDEEYVDPVFVYEHGLGFSITGGHVYRGNKSSSFYGVYIFGDYNTRRVWGLKMANGKLESVRQIGTAPGGIASFGVDHNGEILLVTYDGMVYRLNLRGAKFGG